MRKTSEGSQDQCCSQATAQRRPAKAKRSGRRFWVRKAQALTWIDHGSAGQRCRDLDLNDIPGDARRADPEAPSPLIVLMFAWNQSRQRPDSAWSARMHFWRLITKESLLTASSTLRAAHPLVLACGRPGQSSAFSGVPNQPTVKHAIPLPLRLKLADLRIDAIRMARSMRLT